MILTSQKLRKLFQEVSDAHQRYAKPNASKTRQWGKVPFETHLFWCAFMLLNDVTLKDKRLRRLGFEVLLKHDWLEDTDLPLPDDTDPEVVELVRMMTFDSWDEEKEKVPTLPDFMQLLKLIDKTASIYDRGVSKSKTKEWADLCLQLIQNLDPIYGHTQVFKVCRLIVEEWVLSP